MNISACLIVKNESAVLARCLRSIQSLVDEIIVVDTGSEDSTVSIAAEFGAKIFHFPWQNDFALARNYSLSQASCDWIFHIDADEECVSPPDFRSLIDVAPANVGGFLVAVESRIVREDGSTDTFSANIVRLFRRNSSIRFSGAIHEQILDSVLSAGFSVAVSPLRIIHFGYNLSPTLMRQKYERNIRLLDAEISRKPHDGYSFFQRGKTYLALGRRDLAMSDISSALSEENLSPAIRVQALNYAALLQFQTGNFPSAIRFASESVALLKYQVFAHFVLGETYHELGSFDESLSAYLAARLARQSADTMASIAGDYTLQPEQLCFRIGRAYMALRQWGKAYEEFSKGLEENPNDISCRVGLADISLKSGNADLAVKLLEEASHLAPNREDIPRFLAHAKEMQAVKMQVLSQFFSQSGRPRISGAMIVGNDVDGLDRALSSLDALCDEIILVQTGNNFPADILPTKTRVIRSPWQEDYSQARNVALEHCSGDWIVNLDSDEALEGDTPERIRTAITHAGNTVGGILTSIEHVAHETPSKTEILRIFRRNSAIRYEGFVHEQATASIIRAGFSITEKLDIVFRHYSKPLDEQKRARYRRLLEKEVHRQGNSSETALFQLTLLLFNFFPDEKISAHSYLEQYLRHPLARRDNAAVLLNSYGRLLLTESDFGQLAEVALHSVNRIPEQCEGWWLLLVSAARRADFSIAFEAFGAIFGLLRNNYRSSLAFEKIPSPREVYDVGTFVRDNAEKNWDKSGTLERRSQFRVLIEQFGRELLGILPEKAEEIIPNVSEKLQKTPLISLSMIVKNEEKFLPECLESVRGIADEIVIADTGSSDRTKEIAREFGAKVVEIPWNGDFASARNFSLQHCTGTWILYLDADERLLPEQKAYIRSLLSDASADIGAFICNIVSKHRQNDGRTEVHSGGYPRIFRNYGFPNIQFIGRVHEQITPSILELGKSIALSDVEIRHLGYDQTHEIMQKKVRRNYELLLRHIQEDPTNAYAWFQLGQTLAMMNLNDEAENALKFAVNAGNLPVHIAASAGAVLAQIAGAKKNFSEALRWAEFSLEKAPEQVYALHLKAYSLYYLGQFAVAEELFTEVLRRSREKRGVPQSGFDIAVPESAIMEGLTKAQSRTL